MQKFIYEYPIEKQDYIFERVYDVGNISFRITYFKQDIYLFAIYYFWHNFITWIKDFHKQIYKIVSWDKNALIIWFRESWKTAIVALIYVVYCIAYKIESFILFWCYDLENAVDKVTNIINFLKWNKNLKNDFWLLFDDWEARKRDVNRVIQPKTVSKFVSTNWIKVQAVSIKTMKRWKQLVDEEWNILRPSLFIWDDIDVDESVKNINIIIENFKKFSSTILKSLRWRALILWNIIAEDWVNIRIRDVYCKNTNLWDYLEVSIYDENWKIIWPERYVEIQKEAKKINNEKYDWEKIVTSIEELKIDMDSFRSDYLNKPKIVVWDPVFNLEKIEQLEVLDPEFIYEIEIEWEIFELEIYDKNYSKDKYYYLHAWVDTAWDWWIIVDDEWNEYQSQIEKDNDHTDMTFLDKKWKLFARITSNKLWYDKAYILLCKLTDEFWFLYEKNSLVIERNLYWINLIKKIRKNRPDIAKNIFRKLTDSKWKMLYVSELGWWTDIVSKEQLKDDLSRAINLLKIQITKYMKRELRGWCKEEKWDRIIYTNNKIIAPHDDSVISKWLALQWFLQYNPNFLVYE